jgi:hypothetical protein
MIRSATRRLIALLLAFLLPVGMGLHAVYASPMADDMSRISASDPGGINRTDCGACDGAGNQGMQADNCAPLCVGQLLLLPQPGSIDAALSSQQPALLSSVLLDGRSSAPDPYPPKAVHPV